MTEITLELDQQAKDEMNKLIKVFNAKSRADLISKAMVVLKIAAKIKETDGQLIARKNGRETIINVG